MRSIHLTGCISFQSHLSHSLKSNKFIALVCFVTCDANRSTEDDMLSFPVLQNTHILQGADNVTWMQCCFLAYIWNKPKNTELRLNSEKLYLVAKFKNWDLKTLCLFVFLKWATKHEWLHYKTFACEVKCRMEILAVVQTSKTIQMDYWERRRNGHTYTYRLDVWRK